MSDDNRIFAAYPLRPKISLIDERPRRESLVERQLQDQIQAPQIKVSGASPTPSPISPRTRIPDESYANRQYTSHLNRAPNNAQIIGQQSSSFTTLTRQHQTLKEKAPDLFEDFVQTEAKLLREIEAINYRTGGPLPPATWSYRPGVLRPKARQEPPPHAKKLGARQYEFGPASPRPTSRASSVRSTTSEDLREKEAKLLADIEDIEKKQFKPSTMVIGPSSSQEEFLPSRKSEQVSSIHTTIIKTPARNVDNKSPLPFAYDNFSTKGVHGNIASFGAAEPDNPYPPIYPIIKRSQSPRV